MKTIKFLVALTVVALTTVSCVEKSAKYQALLAQRDSLQSQMTTVQGQYTQTMELLSAVDSGFASLRESEAKLKVDMKGIESQGSTKKQEIAAQFDQMKKILEENKTRLAKLERISKDQTSKNARLAETIKRMQEELDVKTMAIASLQAELEKRDVKINELNTTVTGLNSNIASLNEESQKQQATIKTQDESLNKVWYYIGTSSQLKDAKILNSNGFLRAKTVLDRDFNKAVFTQADKRNLSVIPTGEKSIKVLSNHPKDSYTLTKGSDNTVSLEIKDADKFWSVSKYLVLQK